MCEDSSKNGMARVLEQPGHSARLLCAQERLPNSLSHYLYFRVSLSANAFASVARSLPCVACLTWYGGVSVSVSVTQLNIYVCVCVCATRFV